jgi:hypothetical protein
MLITGTDNATVLEELEPMIRIALAFSRMIMSRPNEPQLDQRLGRSLYHKTNDMVIVKARHWPCPCPGIVRIYVNKHESSQRWKPASQDQRLRFFACLLAFWLFAGLFLLAVGHTRQGRTTVLVVLLVNSDDLADGSSMIAYQQ